MTGKQREEMMAQAMKVGKKGLAEAFINALDVLSSMTAVLSSMTAVLETYIGTENTMAIAVKADDAEFLRSLMGTHETNPEVFNRLEDVLSGKVTE